MSFPARRRLWGLMIWLAAASLAVALLPAPAFAHGKKLPAKKLVEQAIALLRTQPNQVEAIEDKIHDALEAKDATGVDLALVRRADQAFDRRDLHRAWDLLEEAIGAAPHRVVRRPNPRPRMPAATPAPTVTSMPAMPAPGEQAPQPVLHEQALEGGVRAPQGTAGPALLGIAGLLALLGGLVVWRVH
jgi:hypothetical protein